MTGRLETPRELLHNEMKSLPDVDQTKIEKYLITRNGEHTAIAEEAYGRRSPCPTLHDCNEKARKGDKGL